MADLNEEKPKEVLENNTGAEEDQDEEFEQGMADYMRYEEEGGFGYEEEGLFEEDFEIEEAEEEGGEAETGEEVTESTEVPATKGSPKSGKRSASGARERSPSPKKTKTVAEGEE